MKCLVTGGAGFIGRWVVKRLLDEGHLVTALDDLTNGRESNLEEFIARPNFSGLVRGDVADPATLRDLFAGTLWDAVFHLAASIHVQKSIDDPWPTFRNDAQGTFSLLEACREQYFRLNGFDSAARHFDYEKARPQLLDRRPRVACMSTCMVYQLAGSGPITEAHPYRPASPYAASKIGADMLALSYYYSYGLPVTVVRPFNTYGPFQKSNSEGGVVSIFIQRDLSEQSLQIKGDGTQTRDLLYVEDCADFVVRAAANEGAEGQIINAGTGKDIAVKELARLCCSPENRVEHVPHDHPQAEIARLVCDPSKAEEVLGWKPQTTLEQGLEKTRRWLKENRWAW
jgi:dTDP-glucose 4,6-dehydratase